MAMAICRICKQEFERSANAKYCGPDCKRVARQEQSHTPEGRERSRQKKQRQRDSNPEHQREILKKSREKHREQRNEDTRKWFERHPGYVKEQSRRYREKNPDRSREHAQYYQKHKDQISARVSAYTKANPDVLRVKNSNRRALLKKAEGKFTRQEFKELCEQVGSHCSYCHGKFDELTPDHITPLSRGGSNDITNIIPACGPCNYSKQDKTPLEFLIKSYIS